MIVALVAVLAGAAPCQLVEKKEAIANRDFRGVAYQSSCAVPGGKFLASADPIERAAAAAYGIQFTDAGEKKVHVPIVSDFVGRITVARYQHTFKLGKPELEQILAHAQEETSASVLLEQLRHFTSLAGTEWSLKLLRAATKLEADPAVRRDAEVFWRNEVVPKRLTKDELGRAWGFSQGPRALPTPPTKKPTLTPAQSDAVVAEAQRFIEEKKGDCFFMSDRLRAGEGDLPTLLKLAALLKGCGSTFNVIDPVIEGIAATPDPEAAVLEILPVLATLEEGMCRGADALARAVPADAKPSTYVAIAKGLKGCLWSKAEVLIQRLVVTPEAPGTVEALNQLGRLLIQERELWRLGDKLAWAYARVGSEAAGDAMLALARSEKAPVRWKVEGEAAQYYLGGPNAEKRAAAMRKLR